MKKNRACLKKDRHFLHGEEVEEGTSAGGRETDEKNFWPSISTGQVFRSIEVWVLTSLKIWVSST